MSWELLSLGRLKGIMRKEEAAMKTITFSLHLWQRGQAIMVLNCRKSDSEETLGNTFSGQGE